MKVLITGGAGFLGCRLAEKFVARGRLKGPDDHDQAIDEIVLLDVVPAESLADARIRMIVGDVVDAALLRRVIDRGGRLGVSPRRHRERAGGSRFRSGHARER